MPVLKGYILSVPAKADIEEIFEYTENEFGLNQAVKYTLAIEELLFLLVETPEMGKDRNEIKQGLFSFPYHNHIVFYRILNDHIWVVRVLHGNRDVFKFV